MSYPATPETDDAAVQDFLLDLAARKEFRALAPPPPPGPPLPPHSFGFGLSGSPTVPTVDGFRLHGAQIFVRNFFNPNTPYTRLLLNWQTGTGKSIGAITICQEYIRQFRSRIMTPPSDRPSVFVIGFTKSIIQAEMLRHPEFGFVAPNEVASLNRVFLLAEGASNPAGPEAAQYAGLVGSLKRRITDRAQGGYYRFYGYKAFANRLLTATRQGAARGFTVAELYAHARPMEEDLEADAPPEVSLLDKIDRAVAAGDVAIDRELLADLRGGLIVADEIHNTYNIQAKNNYGVAIQYALDKITAESPEMAPRAIFMSATVTGGVATEVVDLLNFLLPVAQLPGQRRLRREDFFEMADGADGRRTAALLPGALEQIGRLSAGRVSFLLDADEASYPRRIFEGTALANPLRPGESIAYLRFTPCPMAPFHEKTLARMLAGGSGARAAIPANAYTLYDMVYPNPEFAPDAAAREGESYGLYLSAETPAQLAAASQKWAAAAGVAVELPRGTRAGGAVPISGSFLGLESGLRLYSAKYQALGEHILEIMRSGPGKIMIYHHRVRMSGVLQIREILEVNGFLDETSGPSPSTLCAVCGNAKRNHSAETAAASWAGPHGYTPARFVVITSEVDRSVLERSIARYNAQTNVEGFEYRILVGSKIIREGFDLKAVRFQLIVSLPTDIPTLIQIFGRVVRKGSHLGLPEDKRDVRIRILVSTAGEYTQGLGPAPEVIRYAEKIEAYFLTQEVEKAIRRYAIDAFINYDRMVTSDPTFENTASIDAIPYRPTVGLAAALRRPQTTSTFEAYGYGDREIDEIQASVQALFETRPVWKYDDLWAAVRSGRVAGVAQNPATFSEESFALALSALGRHVPSVSRLDIKAGEVALVSRVGEFFVRTPSAPGGQPILDIESYVRENVVLTPLRVRVADYVQLSRQSDNFTVRLAKFEKDFGVAGSRIEDIFFEYDADFHHTLLRALVEGFSGAEHSADLRRKASEAGTAFARALDVYTRFKVIVLEGDVAGVPEARRPTKKKNDEKTPIGYVGETSVRIFRGSVGENQDGWYDIPRKALGIGPRYTENDIAVGYVERRGGHLRFKTRPPIHELSTADVRDSRSLARGAVCETRPRPRQEDLLLRLKVSSDFTGLSSADLCAAIRLKLLAREEAARNQKSGMLDGLRWFYLFNDRLPTITLGQ